MSDLQAHRILARFQQTADGASPWTRAKMVHPSELAAAFYSLKTGVPMDGLNGQNEEEWDKVEKDPDAQDAMAACKHFEDASLKSPRVSEVTLRLPIEWVKQNSSLLKKGDRVARKVVEYTIPVYVAFIKYMRAIRESRKQPLLSEDTDELDQEILKATAFYRKHTEDEAPAWVKTPEGVKALEALKATGEFKYYDAHRKAEAAYQLEVLPGLVTGNIQVMKLCAERWALDAIDKSLLLNTNGGVKIAVADAERLCNTQYLQDPAQAEAEKYTKEVSPYAPGAVLNLRGMLQYTAIFDMGAKGQAEQMIRSYGTRIWEHVQHGRGVPCLLIQAWAAGLK